MANECTFDVVSKVDMDEVKNAVAQAMKEIGQRFDFKGSISKIELKDEGALTLTSDDEVRLKAVIEVLQSKLVKRGVSIRAMEFGKIEAASKGAARFSAFFSRLQTNITAFSAASRWLMLPSLARFSQSR